MIINNYTILASASIRDTVKKMDKFNLNSIFIKNNLKKVQGVFTMGDFRRAIFFGLDIDSKITSVLNKNFVFLNEKFSRDTVKKIFFNSDLILDIPILDKNLKIIKIIKKKDFFPKKKKKKKKNLENFPLVIMAGGKGTRLDPFTRILPKSLIPFGNNPIIRVIMDYFKKFGLKKFYISVNDKNSMIKAYFHDLKHLYKIKYIEEKKPLGTAGSLRLLKNKFKKTFFVINSDILVYTSYPSIIKFHKDNNYDITLVSSVRNYKIPYGVCNFDKSGKLISIKEKPHYDFFVNTGLYVFEPKVLKLIPNNIKFDMNELLNKARNDSMKIGVFPVSENSWIDIGQWSEYKKNINKFDL